MCLPLAFQACTLKAPDVIDRHTILEEEAAGDWPEFERDIVDKSREPGPTAFQQTPINNQKRRLYNVLNGELAGQKAANSK